MSNKFEAGRLFLEMVRCHSADFRAERQSGRDGDVVIVRHNYSDVLAAVSITVRGVHEPIQEGNGKGLNFMDKETMEGLVSWATEEIKRKKYQELVDKDNASVNSLISFYGENNG
jgi:hypothetical protein